MHSFADAFDARISRIQCERVAGGMKFRSWARGSVALPVRVRVRRLVSDMLAGARDDFFVRYSRRGVQMIFRYGGTMIVAEIRSARVDFRCFSGGADAPDAVRSVAAQIRALCAAGPQRRAHGAAR